MREIIKNIGTVAIVILILGMPILLALSFALEWNGFISLLLSTLCGCDAVIVWGMVDWAYEDDI